MTETIQTENTQEITSFEDLHLDRKILAALKDMGFEEPSPIQKGAIPLALEGEDWHRENRCLRDSHHPEDQ